MMHTTRFLSASHWMLSAAVAAAIAVSLAGCESALTPDYADRGTGRGSYAESIVAREILKGNITNQVVQTPTIIRAVEVARIDNEGPGPATTSAAARIDPQGYEIQKRGLSAAMLDQPESVFNLSLQEAIARAAKNSLAIKVEGYTPAIRESQIIEAEAVFDPTVFASTQWQDINTPSLTSGTSLGNGQQWVNQIGVRKLMPSGAQAQILTGFTYRDLPGDSVLAPNLSSHNYAPTIGLQVSQPLFRGFGTEVNQANIYLAQRDQRISMATFRRQVITTVADTEEAYYNLVLAKTNLDILERLVRASEQTYGLVLERRDLDATKASLNQAMSALQSRRADLLRAHKDFRQRSDQLKNLLNDPEINIRENSVINPTDRPLVEPIVYSTAECIETALRQRTEIQEARLQLERADIIVQVAKNDLLPKVSLTAGVASNAIENGLDNAFGNTFTGDSLDFNAGISIEFPLGNRGPEAALTRRINERKQAITAMVRTALSVVAEVKLQLRDLLSFYDEVQLRELQRIAAGNEFEGILEIEDIRAKTPEFLQLKLDSQARLAGAEQALAQTIVSYNLAIMRLEQAKGTLLEFNRISLDRPEAERGGNDFGKNRFIGKTYTNK